MYKWSYVKGPESPSAVISATPSTGVAPLTVQFSSEGSNDPDEGDSIRYAWDFDGNGTVDSVEQNPSHVYTTNSVYTAKLTVTDSTGKSDTQSTSITVGNTAPTVTLTVPTEGDFFEWGQRIPFTVTVTDPEDGTIDCSKVEVTFVLIHESHGHAEENVNGCTGFLQTDVADASHGGYLAGGINASYTDKGANGQPALSGQSQRVVQLKRQEVEFAQELRGTTTAATAAPEDGGAGAAISSIDPGDWIALNNRFNLQNMDKAITFRYAGGSAANTAGNPRMAVEIRTGSPTGTLLTTVTLNSTGTNNTTYTSQTFPLNFAGTQRLYLVFRAVTAAGTTPPTTGMGLINWVGFTGPGIGSTP
jgi:PKD repeat protein